MSTMKLQKLVYYSQAWAMVWDDKPLFNESIRAWRDGPCVRELFNSHKGKFHVTGSDIDGNPSALEFEEQATIESVLSSYGKYDGLVLSEMTHSEGPWLQARGDAGPEEYTDTEISLESLQEYYGSL